MWFLRNKEFVFQSILFIKEQRCLEWINKDTLSKIFRNCYVETQYSDVQNWDPGMKDLAGNWTGGQDFLGTSYQKTSRKQCEIMHIAVLDDLEFLAKGYLLSFHKKLALTDSPNVIST